MASAVGNGVVPSDRRTRLNTFDRALSMHSPQRLGAVNGPRKPTWDSSGSIWGNGNHANLFMDGSADTDAQDDSVSTIIEDEKYTQLKVGSGSLLSSSESEGWPGRSNKSWSTASHGTSTVLSRSQGQPLSPVRHRNGATPASTTNLTSSNRNTSSYFSMDESNVFLPVKQASPGTPRHLTGEPQARPLHTSAFAGLPNNSVGQGRHREYNSAAFGTNGSIGSIQPGLPSLGVNTEEFTFHSGATHHKGISVKTRTHFDSPNGYARSSKPLDYSHPGNNAISRLSQRDSDTSTRSYSSIQERGIQERSFKNDGHEDQLSAALSRMNARFEETPQEIGTSFQAQRYSQRPSPNADISLESSLHQTGFHSFSENTPVVPLSHYENGIFDRSQHFPSDRYGNMSFTEHESASPGASDYRPNLNSPFYSTSATPPTGPESIRSTPGSGVSSHTSNGHVTMIDRKLRNSLPFPPEQNYTASNHTQPRMQYNQSFEFSGYPGSLRLNPLANPYPVPSHHGMVMNPYSSRYPSRDQDPSQIVRSVVLEDFRTNHKTNKRYELKDIYKHVVEFSGDQHGSRFIQQKLETANSDEKDQIFMEIQTNALQLMTDVFGNYVIQKLFEHGNQAQKKILANQMRGYVLALSTQMYGCRVVQKALEHILTDQQASMVKELEPHVLKCVKDQNGNHVIQKAIERVPAKHIQFIINAFTDQVQRLATHPYGCRVIQRMLEHCEEPARQSILRELHACVPMLIIDQFGNYVIQHVIENGGAQDRSRIVSIVTAQLLIFSKHKFASNVVEKSIECAEDGQRAEILRLLTTPNEKGESPVLGLMRDQYGNYVIQKVLGQLKGVERENLVNQIKPQLMHLKKFSYGKQIIAIEKLIFDGDTDPSLSASSQSSTLPSTNASTVEGPVTPPQVQIMKPTFTLETPISVPPNAD